MKKKFIIPLSIAMALASVTAVSAAQETVEQPQYGIVSDYEVVSESSDATYGQFRNSVNSNNEAVIKGLTAEAASDTDIHLIIPANINGYNAFYGCVNLTGTITFPSTITRVGDTYKTGAFNNDSSLENITLTIGANAFKGDIELTSITLNEGLKTIGEGAFNGCNNLGGKLVIPSTVTKIGYDMYSSGAFADTAITSVDIKDGNAAIKEVKLPSKTKTIGRYAFKDCAKLKKIEFNEGLTSIGESAFTNCTSLGGVINIPSTVTLIETSYGERTGVFSNTDIFGVVIADGNSGINIGVNAFNGCTGLKNVYY